MTVLSKELPNKGEEGYPCKQLVILLIILA